MIIKTLAQLLTLYIFNWSWLHKAKRHDGILPKRNKSETVLSVKELIPKNLSQCGITPQISFSDLFLFGTIPPSRQNYWKILQLSTAFTPILHLINHPNCLTLDSEYTLPSAPYASWPWPEPYMHCVCWESPAECPCLRDPFHWASPMDTAVQCRNNDRPCACRLRRERCSICLAIVCRIFARLNLGTKGVIALGAIWSSFFVSFISLFWM